MKVFISWSGEVSHKVAREFWSWLPKVIQSVQPYLSSEDIPKGSRWITKLTTELEATKHGIFCLTADNLDSRWLNFEAGALSKSVTGSSVSPFLFDLKKSSVEGPLAQFHFVENDKEDLFRMVSDINNSLETGPKLGTEALRDSFEVRWPKLEEALDRIAKQKPSPPDGLQERTPAQILEELLELARAQQQQRPATRNDMAELVLYLRDEIRKLGSPTTTSISDIGRSFSEFYTGPNLLKGLAGVKRLSDIANPKPDPDESK